MLKKQKVRVLVDKLVVGMFVDLEMSWTEHPFLFARFKITSANDIAKIKTLGKTDVCVLPHKCDRKVMQQAKEADLLSRMFNEASDETPQKENEDKRELLEQAKLYRERHKKISQKYKQQSERVKKIAKALKTEPANAVRDVDEVVEGLASEFDDAGELLTNLVNLGSGEHTFFNHNLNVTVLSLMLGSAAGFRGEALRQLATGALLHDVGKILVPYQIVHKTGKLTPGEMVQLHQHPALGRRLTERIREMPPMTLSIIGSHHELMDGSGYPEGIGGGRIPKQVQVVTICDIYDNLCNAKDPRKSLTPKMALATMYKHYQNRIDPELLSLFITTMGVYPPGTVVQLNDDSIGLVVAVEPKALLRPELLLYNPEIPKNEALIINLQEHPELEISSMLKPGDYPKEIYEYLGIQERLGYFVDKASGPIKKAT